MARTDVQTSATLVNCGRNHTKTATTSATDSSGPEQPPPARPALRWLRGGSVVGHDCPLRGGSSSSRPSLSLADEVAQLVPRHRADGLRGDGERLDAVLAR